MNSTTHIHLKRRPRAGGAKPQPFELRGTPESNKAVVRDFYDLAFNRRQPAEAVAKHVGNHYRQHNPGAADGSEAFGRKTQGGEASEHYGHRSRQSRRRAC